MNEPPEALGKIPGPQIEYKTLEIAARGVGMMPMLPVLVLEKHPGNCIRQSTHENLPVSSSSKTFSLKAVFDHYVGALVPVS